MDAKEKIQQFIDYKGININQFEISIGVSKSYWRKTKSISANIVIDISRIYTDLNLEWLFRGTGSMLLTEQSQHKPSLQAGDTEAEIEKLKMQIARLEGQNDLLREQIGMSETKRSKTA